MAIGMLGGLNTWLEVSGLVSGLFWTTGIGKTLELMTEGILHLSPTSAILIISEKSSFSRGLLVYDCPKRLPKLLRDSRREFEGLVEKPWVSNLVFEKLVSVKVSKAMVTFASLMCCFWSILNTRLFCGRFWGGMAGRWPLFRWKFFLWFERLLDCLKEASQPGTSQTYGFRPVCKLTWSLRYYGKANWRWQYEQVYYFASWWVAWCLCIPNFEENVIVQPGCTHGTLFFDEAPYDTLRGYLSLVCIFS